MKLRALEGRRPYTRNSEPRLAPSMPALAEAFALMFDRDGRPVRGLDDRKIGSPLTDLKAVPNVIAVGGGPDKANAFDHC